MNDDPTTEEAAEAAQRQSSIWSPHDDPTPVDDADERSNDEGTDTEAPAKSPRAARGRARPRPNASTLTDEVATEAEASPAASPDALPPGDDLAPAHVEPTGSETAGSPPAEDAPGDGDEPSAAAAAGATSPVGPETRAPGAGPEGAVPPVPGIATRSVDGRLARLHLRGGSITLARAELETMAGHGTLDREALADLAEARWRSGDLVGGGEAARAHLDAGGNEPLAMVVAAEALAAEGRLVESRQLASRVAERAPGLVERLFAGQARSHSWANLDADPDDREEIATWGLLSGGQDVISPGRKLRRPRPDDQPRDAEGRPIGGPHIAPRAAGTITDQRRQAGTDAPGAAGPGTAPPPPPPPDEGRARGRPVMAEAPGRPPASARRDVEAPAAPVGRPPSDRAAADASGVDRTGSRAAPPGATEQAVQLGRVAGRELGSIEDAIGRGETASIAARLALLLRLDRALAPVILSLADRAVSKAAPDDPEVPALHLVRGDAYRLLGREVEATAAFQRSRLALGASRTDEEPT